MNARQKGTTIFLNEKNKFIYDRNFSNNTSILPNIPKYGPLSLEIPGKNVFEDLKNHS